MISIDPDRLYAGYDALKSVCGSLAGLSSAAADAQRRLSGTTGMEDAVLLLRHTNSELYDQIERCRRLCRCVDTICQYYISCENQVLDYGENAIICFPHPSTEFVDLAAAMDVLREFSYGREE